MWENDSETTLSILSYHIIDGSFAAICSSRGGMRLFHWRFLGQDSFKILCQSQVDVGPSRKCRLVEVFAKSDLALHLDQRLLKEEDVSLEQGAALGLDSFNPSHPRHNSFARDSLQNGAILKEDTQATTGRGSVARVDPF